MKNLILLFLVAILTLQSCKYNKKAGETTVINEQPATSTIIRDSTLVTDTSWGLINSSADFSSLKEVYGASNVKDERICGAECIDSVDVTIIYPATKKEMTIYWEDSSSYHKKIARIESYMEGAPYHTPSGLRIGSTLVDLLKVNGKKINFSGFDWDYGGYIQSYNGGTLDKSPVNFRLEPAETIADGLSGDIELSTDMPLVKKEAGKVHIASISLSFTKD